MNERHSNNNYPSLQQLHTDHPQPPQSQTTRNKYLKYINVGSNGFTLKKQAES